MKDHLRENTIRGVPLWETEAERRTRTSRSSRRPASRPNICRTRRTGNPIPKKRFSENAPEMAGSEEGWQGNGVAHGPDYARDTIPDADQETEGFSFDPGMTGLAGEGPRITS